MSSLEIRDFGYLRILQHDRMRIVDESRPLVFPANAPALVAPYHLDRLLEYWERGRDPICRNAPHLFVAHAVEGAQLAHVDCILALGYMELSAMPMGLGATWAGFVMLAASLYPPFQEALNLPNGHKCFGAMMIGYPTYRFARMPPRNPPPVTWRKSGGSG